MNHKGLVTVIVPIFKIEQYIESAINSILSQSYKNLEIILVDDGSPDKCPVICDKYAETDDRIIVIHRENGGLSAARNSGLDKATGEYIYFVDGDDLIHVDCIQKLINIMCDQDADIVQCSTLAFLREDRIDHNLQEERLQKFTGEQMCERLMYNFEGGNGTVVWNKLYRAELFDDIRFPEGMIYEDVATTHRLLWKSKRVVTTTQNLAYYRSARGNSITHSTDKKLHDLIKADNMRSQFFKDVGRTDLFEQGIYLLCNNYTRYRILSGDDSEKKKEHRGIEKQVRKSGLPGRKKIIAMWGCYMPHVWFAVWKVKMFYRVLAYWKWESIKILKRL